MLAIAALFGQGVARPWIPAVLDRAGDQVHDQFGQIRDWISENVQAGASPTDAVTSPAAALLNKLPVKGPAPKSGYQREQFGPAWSDDVPVSGGRNGCDPRIIRSPRCSNRYAHHL